MAAEVILLVEDRLDDITLTEWAFRKCDISNEIIVARDGIEALELLLPTDGSRPLRPLIILMDLSMPRMNGLECLRRLRADASTKAIPVIMLTTSTDETDMTESYLLGANSYIQKPITSDGFMAAAKALGVYWLHLNQQSRPSD
jgi:CheY-like chemotaxis protein